MKFGGTMGIKGNHSAVPAFLGYLYQIRMSLFMSFDVSDETIIYIEKGDDIELENFNNQKLIQLKHKKENEILSDFTIDFWKSAKIWLKSYNNKKNSHYFLYTTSKFDVKAILKKLCNSKNNEFNEEDINQIFSILENSTNTHLVEVKTSLKELSLADQLLFFNRITIIENQERIEEVKNSIINYKLKLIDSNHRINFYEELEGWWTNKVIEMMNKNQGITANEISLKLKEINHKYLSTNLPSPNEFMSDIDYSIYFEGNYLFINKGKKINLRKNQLKWCILDFLKTHNDRNYWIENALISWDEIQLYEKRLEQEFLRKKDMLFDEDDELTLEERIEIGKNLYFWVQELDINIRSHVQALHICKGTFYIIADDMKKNFEWLP